MGQHHLYRSIKDRKIAGVAGGIAEYLQVDSAAVRLIWLMAILFGGAGFLAYIIAWIIIPEERINQENESPVDAEPVTTEPKPESNSGMSYIGIFLIGLGAFFLLKEFVPFGLVRYFWPLALIGLGIFLLIPRK